MSDIALANDFNVTFSPAVPKEPEKMLPIGEAIKSLKMEGFEKIWRLDGSTFKDVSTVMICPTRGMVHYKVVHSWLTLLKGMNAKCTPILFANGQEVGMAYNNMISNILANPDLAKFKYVFCCEDDNILPPDALIRLYESIEQGPFDGVSGIYVTKGEGLNAPQCYGDAKRYRETGYLDFRPVDIRSALANGNIVECLGVAQGCVLYRMGLFKEIPPPWYVTVNDVVDGGAKAMTQDLYFAERCIKAGKRFAVDMRVKVGHIDIESGVVY